jgi:hypothetical protein
LILIGTHVRIAAKAETWEYQASEEIGMLSRRKKYLPEVNGHRAVSFMSTFRRLSQPTPGM